VCTQILQTLNRLQSCMRTCMVRHATVLACVDSRPCDIAYSCPYPCIIHAETFISAGHMCIYYKRRTSTSWLEQAPRSWRQPRGSSRPSLWRCRTLGARHNRALKSCAALVRLRFGVIYILHAVPVESPCGCLSSYSRHPWPLCV